MWCKNQGEPTTPARVLLSDTSDSRHFGTSAKMSIRYFGTSAELSGHIVTRAKVSYRHFGTKEDTSAPGHTGPSRGKVDGVGCACVINRIRLTQQRYKL